MLTWNGLIPGAYAVAETDPGNEWKVTITSASVTVPSDGGQAQATVTNTKLADPRITVTKVVTETTQPHWSFVLRLDGGDPKTVASDQPQAIWDNLEANRTYTLSEDEPGNGWAEGTFECNVNGVSVGEPLPDGDLQLRSCRVMTSSASSTMPISPLPVLTRSRNLVPYSACSCRRSPGSGDIGTDQRRYSISFRKRRRVTRRRFVATDAENAWINILAGFWEIPSPP